MPKLDNETYACPQCGRSSLIQAGNYTNEKIPLMASPSNRFPLTTKDKRQLTLVPDIIVCPTPECHHIYFALTLNKDPEKIIVETPNDGGRRVKKEIHTVGEPDALFHKILMPPSNARMLPDFVPQIIREDYTEACEVLSASPKASAALSRRCMQSMLRDFWSVKPADLWKEIEEIKTKIPTELYDALTSIRSVGNIGAHPEHDVAMIVPVEPDEAQMLIRVLEIAIEEWYIARERSTSHLKKAAALTAKKAAEKKAAKTP